MASYVTVTQTEDNKKWTPVAMMYDSGTKEYRKIVWSMSTTDRSAAVSEGRRFAVDNDFEFIA